MAEHDSSNCGCRTIDCEGEYKIRNTLQSNYPCGETAYHLEVDNKEAHLSIWGVLWAALGIVHLLIRRYVSQYLLDGDLDSLQQKLDRMLNHIKEMENWN